MIGTMYESDQRIVDLYKDTCTIAEAKEDKLSPETVLNYIELISIANKSTMNMKKLQFKKQIRKN